MNHRYDRHYLIDWFDQEIIKNSHVTVIGAGAVGNEVLKNLALLGIGKIDIYDFDMIEEHNLTRCVLFRESDVGRYKAEVAASYCNQIDANISVNYSCTDFWDTLTLSKLRNTDAVICCVDNYEARLNLNKLCLMAGVDFFNTGMDSRYINVEIFPFSTSIDCACYECTLPYSAYNSIQKRYSCGWLRKVAFEENKIPTTAVTSSLAGASVVSILINRLNNHPQALQTAMRFYFDAITLSSTLSIFQRNDNCAMCSTIDPEALYFTCYRDCADRLAIKNTAKSDVTISFSEPILLRSICKQCLREVDFYESARKINDGIIYCTNCKSETIEPTIIEQMTIDEFTNTFTGKIVPCKFIICNARNKQIILEMEGRV